MPVVHRIFFNFLLSLKFFQYFDQNFPQNSLKILQKIFLSSFENSSNFLYIYQSFLQNFSFQVADAFPKPMIVRISSHSYSWIADIQKTAFSNEGQNILLIAEKDTENVILGIFNYLRGKFVGQNFR